MAARNRSQVRRGVPEQLPLMKLNRRCSIGFHFEQPRWVVADGDLQPQPIAQHGLEPLLPQPRPIAIAATSVSQDQQPLGSGKDHAAVALPPAGNRVDRKGRRVSRRADVDGAAVVEHIVDTVRDGHRQVATGPRRMARCRAPLLLTRRPTAAIATRPSSSATLSGSTTASA